MTDNRNDVRFGKAETNPEIPHDDQSLLKLFENLGDNCELGLLQRYGGIERPSLLRFNYTDIDKLIRGLKNRFEDLARPGQVTVEWTDEWMVKETVYGFSYHTFNTDPHYDQARLIKEQERWLRYMAEKFLEELEIGDRIYVRKGGGNESEHAIRALSAALRAYGPATLLWVTVEDHQHPAGSVAWMDDHIMRGWIAGFAPYSRAFDVETSNWLKLLRAAWGLLKHNDPAALSPPSRSSLIPTDFGGWTGAGVATNEFDWTVPRTPPDGLVMKHTLLKDLSPPTEIFGCLLVNRVKPGQPYVALVDVWLPTDFAGDHVCLVFISRPSVAIRRAVKTKTNTWQTIWVSTYLGDGDSRAFPRIELVGPAGTVFYTTNWRLHEGLLPPV
jgi:hypothetical protein